MNARVLLLALLTLAASGCALPDYDRGKLAVNRGDYTAAESDLQPLAERGMSDAARQLARAHARQETPEDLKQAAYWYGTVLPEDPAVAVPLAHVLMRLGDMPSIVEAVNVLRAADARGDSRALVALIEIYADFPELDSEHSAPELIERAKNVDSPEVQAAVVQWYRRNVADPASANALLERCRVVREKVPDCYVDLARSYRTAGRKAELKALTEEMRQRYDDNLIPALVMERYGWTLVADDVAGDVDPATAYSLLQQVAEDSPPAQIRVARLLVEYPYIDPQGNPEKLLQKAYKAGSNDAALGLGRLYMSGVGVPADPKRAVGYLNEAARTLPAAHYYLGRIYRKGQLGTPDPKEAAQHFLLAARGGYINADAALAQVYTDNKGVRPNPANAFVFASLAARNGVPEGADLLKQVRATMNNQQLADGQRLLAEETEVRRLSLPDAMLAAAAGAPNQESAP